MARIPAPVALAALVLGGFLIGDRSGGAAVAGGAVLVLVGLVLAQMRRAREERARRRLEQAAFTDPLTGLANRRTLQLMGQHELHRQRRDRSSLAVLMLDLDGFKQVNDRLGHDAGDELLCDVALALTRTVRAQDTVARLGGDEFCVLAPDTEDGQILSRRVLAALSTVTGPRERLSASVGVAMFPDDGGSLEQLLRTADGRLLSAKRRRPPTREGSRLGGAGERRAA